MKEGDFGSPFFIGKVMVYFFVQKAVGKDKINDFRRHKSSDF